MEIMGIVMVTKKDVWNTRYQWNPCKHITAYELAVCLSFIESVSKWFTAMERLSQENTDRFDKLPPDCKRHFLIFTYADRD